MNENINYSIIVPVYNSECFIEQLIKKFNNCNFIDMELLLIDDGSTDRTKDIIKIFVSKNIKYYYKENGGPSSARNYGISISRGKYLTFIDSDDCIDFDKIYKNFKSISDSNIDLLIIPFINSKYKLNTYFVDKQNEIPRLIISEQINSPCNKIYCKKIIQENNLKFDNRWDLGEDLIFNIDYYKYCNVIKYSNLRYYTYIKRENSLTCKYRKNKIKILLEVNNELYARYKNLSSSIDNSIQCIRIKNFYSCLKDIININRTLKFKLKEIKELKIIFDCKRVSNIKYEILRILFILLPSYCIYILSLILFRKRKKNVQSFASCK